MPPFSNSWVSLTYPREIQSHDWHFLVMQRSSNNKIIIIIILILSILSRTFLPSIETRQSTRKGFISWMRDERARREIRTTVWEIKKERMDGRSRHEIRVKLQVSLQATIYLTHRADREQARVVYFIRPDCRLRRNRIMNAFLSFHRNVISFSPSSVEFSSLFSPFVGKVELIKNRPSCHAQLPFSKLKFNFFFTKQYIYLKFESKRDSTILYIYKALLRTKDWKIF